MKRTSLADATEVHFTNISMFQCCFFCNQSVNGCELLTEKGQSCIQLQLVIHTCLETVRRV